MSPRTRNRRINTCHTCRKLKRKCNRQWPCLHCQRTLRECIFPPSATSSSSTPTTRHTSSQEPREILEFSRPGSGFNGANIATNRSRKPLDMCLRIGKLSITDRIGGLLRANYIQTLEEVLQGNTHGADPMDQFAAPVVAWFKPHSTLRLDLWSSSKADAAEDLQLSDSQTSKLLDRFFACVHPICSVVSRQDVSEKDELKTTLRMSMLYAAAVSMPLFESQKLFGMAKDSLVRKLKQCAEHALCEADILAQLTVKLFQALVIYLTPQYTSEISRSHSIYIGAIIRHFQIAGFDRDLEEDTETERQTKRHLWQHLLFLNTRAAEAVGPERTVIDDPNSSLPRPLQNEEESLADPSSPDCMVALIRYECYRIHRLIFRERENIKRGTVTVESFLVTLDQLITAVRTKYLDRLDDRVPLQKYAGILGRLLLARCESMFVSAQREGWFFPDPVLRKRAIKSCLEIVETGALLETDPDVAQWAWYAGAYQQYHSIVLLTVSIYQTPDLPEVDRIMAMIDHIFGPSATIPVQERSGTVLRALRDNLESFIAAGASGNSRLLYRNSKRDNTNDFTPTPPSERFVESHGVGEMIDQSLNFLDMTSMTGIVPPILDEDIWWPWPPDAPLVEPGNPFEMSAAYAEASQHQGLSHYKLE